METNNRNVQALAARFAAFNQQLIDFVAQCPADDWRKVTKAEGWSVGVTAHHIGATHYPLLEWVQMFVEGRPLPPVTMAMVDEMNRQHAEAHANCTPAEVLEILRRDSNQALAYLQTINDTDLERPAGIVLGLGAVGDGGRSDLGGAGGREAGETDGLVILD